MKANIIALLNELIETSKDGERGFMKAAEEVRHASLNDALLESAELCSRDARELQDLVSELGGRPKSDGSVAGVLHRGWLGLKSAVGGRTDHAILDDCEKDEDAAEKRFHDALEQDLPADVNAVVERLYQGVAQDHDRIRAVRDQHAPVKA
ncbi:PA2169 family four-helix-bundle protein [Paraburkholderia phymatum]|uniref:PA2169 family four-helix-bundle protein n=1 Tax=Paraburkholderia phymatum TaxID=148447 RepID=UPI00317683C2